MNKMKRFWMLAVPVGVGAVLFAILSTRSLPSASPPAGAVRLESPGAALQRSTAQRSRVPSLVHDAALTNAVNQSQEPPKLSVEQIDAYLARYGTNAETLLAAFHVGPDGRHYLRMAATNFPEHPGVQLYVASLDVFPGQKQEWLDRLKKSAPDNSVANYLSASEHLRAGNKELALKEFETASNKTGFSDYSLEAAQRAEDILLASGKSPGQAKVEGMSTTLLPALAQFKGLSQGMADVMKESTAAGDAQTANTLAEMNYRLGQRLATDGGGHFLIHQLVGYAIERITLSRLDPQGQYEFLGDNTPAQRIEQLQAERVRVRELAKLLPEDIASDYNNPEWISYFDRIKVYGERAALEWLRERRQGAPTQP